MTRATCLDLRPVCKERRWRWRYDMPMNSNNSESAWHVEIPGRLGTIYPYGGSDLAVCIEGHARVRRHIVAIDPTVCAVQGDVVYRFPIELIDAVAEIIQPWRKRSVSPEQLTRLVSQLSRGRALKSVKSSQTVDPYQGHPAGSQTGKQADEVPL